MLGISAYHVKKFRTESLSIATTHATEARLPLEDDDRIIPLQRAPYGKGPGPHMSKTTRKITAEDVIDPDSKTAQEAFELRRRGLPYPEIAQLLHIQQHVAAAYVKAQLRALQDDELHDADLARRMQLEQLEEMIRAVHAPATGQRPDGTRGPPIFEAMDRLMRLLDQKAKLLGLNAPQKVDIEHRLVTIANESGYDLEELKEIAAQVLQDLQSSGVLHS